MKILLSIERSTTVASVAVFDSARRVLASESDSTHGSGDAFPIVMRALEAAGVSPADVAEFAVGIGPGSFSGVRSALALARGMAAATGVSVSGVCTAAAMARAYRAAHSDAPAIRVLGDARRGHLWLYSEPGPGADASWAACGKLMDRTAFVPDASCVYLLADPQRLEPLFEGCAVPHPAAMVDASDIAALYDAGIREDADPIYLHPAVTGPITSEV